MFAVVTAPEFANVTETRPDPVGPAAAPLAVAVSDGEPVCPVFAAAAPEVSVGLGLVPQPPGFAPAAPGLLSAWPSIANAATPPTAATPRSATTRPVLLFFRKL